MSKSFKVAALAGAMSMALSGVASAAAPGGVPNFQYDGWTVTNGEINENAGGMCASANYSCSVVASGAGFKQINVTDVADASSGTSYIMTIVTDQGATGGAADLGFADVSFVRMKLTLGGVAGNGESGITARQSIKDGAGTGKVFDSITDINTGWAATSDKANIVVSQQLTDDGGTAADTGDDFSSGFIYRSNNDPITGLSTGFEMSIDQVAGLASAIDPASVADVQVFALRQKKGSFQNATNTTGINLAGDTTPVTWAAEDDIKAMWIGQEINLGGIAGLGAGSLGSSFGYVSFENVTDENRDSAFGFSAANSQSAWEWDNAFFIDETAAPVLP